MGKTNSKNEQQESLTSLVAIIVLVLVAMALYLWLTTTWLDDWTVRAQFGDMFGAANTLFSGLAFAVLTYALHLQRKELALQREELALTRAELAKQTAAQSQQAEIALRAAKINGFGSLYQAYLQYENKSGKGTYHPLSMPATRWDQKIDRVHKALTKLLNEDSPASTVNEASGGVAGS